MKKAKNSRFRRLDKPGRICYNKDEMESVTLRGAQAAFHFEFKEPVTDGNVENHRGAGIPESRPSGRNFSNGEVRSVCFFRETGKRGRGISERSGAEQKAEENK